MKLDFSNKKSIYLQIAENMEDDIIKGVYPEKTQVPSTNRLAATLGINPATAGKGIMLLVNEGIIFKKRGIGMFVAEGAVDRIRQKRKSGFFNQYIVSLFEEAAKIGITNQELVQMIIEGGKHYK